MKSRYILPSCWKQIPSIHQMIGPLFESQLLLFLFLQWLDHHCFTTSTRYILQYFLRNLHHSVHRNLNPLTSSRTRLVRILQCLNYRLRSKLGHHSPRLLKDSPHYTRHNWLQYFDRQTHQACRKSDLDPLQLPKQEVL